MAANTQRNAAAFMKATAEQHAALMERLLARSTRPARDPIDLNQRVANVLAGIGNGVGSIVGAAPAARDNFHVALNAQREIQAAQTVLFAKELAEKVLRLRGM